MNLKQLSLFKKLKKEHAYDVALAQKGQKLDDEDLYESLCLLHYSKLLTDASNQFLAEYEGTSLENENLCFLTSAAILVDNLTEMLSDDDFPKEEIKDLFDDIYLTVSKGND